MELEALNQIVLLKLIDELINYYINEREKIVEIIE